MHVYVYQSNQEYSNHCGLATLALNLLLLVTVAASLSILLAFWLWYTSMSAQDKYFDYIVFLFGKYLAGLSAEMAMGIHVETYCTVHRIVGLSVLSPIHMLGNFGNRPRGSLTLRPGSWSPWMTEFLGQLCRIGTKGADSMEHCEWAIRYGTTFNIVPIGTDFLLW